LLLEASKGSFGLHDVERCVLGGANGGVGRCGGRQDALGVWILEGRMDPGRVGSMVIGSMGEMFYLLITGIYI